MTNFEKVQEWHKVFGCRTLDKPSFPEDDLRDLRLALITEEVNEIYEAERANDIVGLAKELADLLYVTYGMADCYGIPLDKVFEEVQKSNMSKLGEDGKPVKRADGKILKGPNFFRAEDNVRKVLNS